MEEKLLTWEVPTYLVHELGNLRRSVTRIEKNESWKYEISSFISVNKSKFNFAMIILLICLIIMQFSEENSRIYEIAFYFVLVVVGVRFLLTIFVNIVSIYISKFFNKDVQYYVTSKSLIKSSKGKENIISNLEDIKKAVIKEIKFNKGSKWELQVKHINKKWHKLEIPVEKKYKILSTFKSLNIPISISSKPKRGYFV